MEPREAETLRLDLPDRGVDTPLALYVMGPHGGTRHLLRRGHVAYIGRSSHATISIDDPSISRLHAALHVGESLTISDLGSSNGTFLRGGRLAPRETRAIACDDVFSVGNCALVLRPSGIAPTAAHRFIALEDLRSTLRVSEALAASQARSSQGWIIQRVHPTGNVDLGLLAAILSEFQFSPPDWLMRIGDRDLAIGVAVASGAGVAYLQRAALTKLASWGLAGDVETTYIGDLRSEAGVDAAFAFLRGSPVVTTRERGPIVLRGAAMGAIHRILKRIAPARVSVLILGETGVGKDLVASMIHEMSPRAAKPLVRLNCASLPEQLIESQLFGHERGAFTGAVSATTGLLEAANGGTIFLDEIGELAPALQPKLLRAIESSEVVRVGGVLPRPIDVRFVAATNRELGADVAAGRFRRDLFHRLNCVTVTVPALRDRRDEIAALARRFLASACALFDLPQAHLSDESLAALDAHDWPGNVRELRNVIERAALIAVGPLIEPSDLDLQPGPASVSVPIDVDSLARPGMATSEVTRIEQALLRCGGNQSRAAELLGMPRRTLVRRISKLGLTRPRTSLR